jgi:hypothetical protein
MPPKAAWLRTQASESESVESINRAKRTLSETSGMESATAAG